MPLDFLLLHRNAISHRVIQSNANHNPCWLPLFDRLHNGPDVYDVTINIYLTNTSLRGLKCSPVPSMRVHQYICRFRGTSILFIMYVRWHCFVRVQHLSQLECKLAVTLYICRRNRWDSHCAV